MSPGANPYDGLKSPHGSQKVATNQTTSPMNSLTDYDYAITPKSPAFNKANLILVENAACIAKKN